MNAKVEQLPVGIHKISMDEYLALPYLSASLIRVLNDRSAYHAKWEQGHHEDDASDASDVGTAIHDGLLEGINRIEVIEAKDWRTNAAKELRDAARAAGKIPLLAKYADGVQGAIDAGLALLNEHGIELGGGIAEHVMIWREGTVLCKARPDWMPNDHSFVLHVKTTQSSAEPNSWIRNQLPIYDMAIPFYDCALAETGAQNINDSVFLVIEQKAPHGCSLIGLSPIMYELAERKVTRAVAIWSECVKTGNWPGYPTEICYAEPTKWQMDEVDMRESIDEQQRFTAKELENGVPL